MPKTNWEEEYDILAAQFEAIVEENTRLREENSQLERRLAVYEGKRCPDCTDGQQWEGGWLVVCPTCEGSGFVPERDTPRAERTRYIKIEGTLPIDTRAESDKAMDHCLRDFPKREG